jgi:2-keto-4-pentenoate hydratase/2-oxohepta-3-ene-1,7-dioic acid hydratase in catechol pathway
VRIASFHHNEVASYGVIAAGGIIDAGKRLGAQFPTLRSVLEADALAALARAIDGAAPDFALAEIEFAPVIPVSDKILCAGLNYRSHVLEGGRDLPQHPVIFTRYSNAQVGHLQPMMRPKLSDRFDFEGEMAAVIGRAGRHIAEADALDHVAGYACFNDGSVRDWQRHSSQFIPGKNFFASGAFGPWMVTADEIPDPATLTLVTRLNGEEMQRATTDDLLFTTNQLIAYCSAFTELVPGDVIVTGTTGGVGLYRDPPLFMKAGDVIEVELDRIGVLTNPIIDEG